VAKTKYVVLEESTHTDEPEAWTLYDVGVEATSSAGALRIALKGQGNLGSRYVAVPQRSWQPQPVEVETQQKLKIG
jgi:hypothetical protein